MSVLNVVFKTVLAHYDALANGDNSQKLDDNESQETMNAGHHSSSPSICRAFPLLLAKLPRKAISFRRPFWLIRQDF
jgi:hypothetical protein